LRLLFHRVKRPTIIPRQCVYARTEQTQGRDRLVQQQRLTYLATGLLSYVAVTVLERLANGFEGQMLRTEIYSIHGFSHLFFGIGLASAVLFLRPRSSAKLVLLAVLVAGIVWELYEGLWLSGEPLDSLEDVMLGILSASAFLCYVRRTGQRGFSKPG
jgi:hypothetical protein